MKPVVTLTGQDGNVFNLMSICVKGMIQNEYPRAEREMFIDEVVQCEDYDEALQTMMKWCEVR